MREIYWEDRAIGTVNMDKEGLYYRISCACKPEHEGRYHIVICSEAACIDLGLCVPNGNTYTLVTRIPIKRLKGNTLRFTLQNTGKKAVDICCIPVSADSPFPFLHKLKASRFLYKSGMPTIIIDPTQDQSGSDLSQEHLRK